MAISLILCNHLFSQREIEGSKLYTKLLNDAKQFYLSQVSATEEWVFIFIVEIFKSSESVHKLRCTKFVDKCYVFLIIVSFI